MIYILTGDGKGKTTSAVGMSVRAYGAGLRVLFLQFLKSGKSSEIKVLEDLFDVKVFGRDKFIIGDPEKEDYLIADEGVKYLENNISKYDFIVLDELNYLIDLGLIKKERIIKILEDNKEKEIVITGRGGEELFEISDLITDMKKIKHYFDKGLKAQKGIEL